MELTTTDRHARYAAVLAFLAEAGVRPDFAAAVQTRVEAQTDTLDLSYQWCSISGLLADATRQAEDVAGYAAVLAARLERDADSSSTHRRARALLTAATQRAGEAHTLLSKLRRLVERAA